MIGVTTLLQLLSRQTYPDKSHNLLQEVPFVNYVTDGVSLQIINNNYHNRSHKSRTVHDRKDRNKVIGD